MKQSTLHFAFIIHLVSLFILIKTADLSPCQTEEISQSRLIFEDNFDTFNPSVWDHEISMAGRTNGEFQMYDDDIENSYVRNGTLFIRPTYLVDKYGSDFLYRGTLDLGQRCTGNRLTEDCVKTGNESNILSPIVSARINTKNSFSFRYGKLEVRAKLPAGDWIWPAIWLLPKHGVYGEWPKSGEIDILESRGNRELFTYPYMEDIGSNQFGSTLHFGLNRTTDRWRLAHFKQNNPFGFNSQFHTYSLVWNPDEISFYLDEQLIGRVMPPETGFWGIGHFTGPKLWSANKMSPFDHQFYIVMNVAVGGTFGYFPDNTGPYRKPWKNNSPTALLDFWEARQEWQPSWDGENSAMQVDYVRVWSV